MKENHLAKKIVAYRKKKGFSQEKLAESLEVSRQAVTKWEKGQSKPSSGNLFKLAELFEISTEELLYQKESDLENTEEHKSWIFVGISVLCLLIYGLFCFLKKDFQLGTWILLFILFVPIQLFLQLYFSYSVKHDSYEGIAGFDQNIEVDFCEVRKLIAKINLHLQMGSSVFIFLFCITNGFHLKFNEGLLFLYLTEFLFAILFASYQGIDAIYQKEEDRKKAKLGFPLAFLYLVNCLCGILLLTKVFTIKGIENNTLSSLEGAGILLLGILLSTIGFFIENRQIKKRAVLDLKFRYSLKGMICLGGSFAIYLLLFLI